MENPTNHLSDFNVWYSTNELHNMITKIEKLKTQLDPQNFDSTKTHISVEEKYEYRELLNNMIWQISMLKFEVDSPTGPKIKPKRRWNPFRRK